DGREGLPAETRADILLGGLHRRRFLQIAGVSVLVAAVLGACSKSPRNSGGGVPSGRTTTTDAAGHASDVRILRTASSLEHFLVGVYVAASGSGLIKAPPLADAAKYFTDQHSQHASAFEGATVKGGGQPFTQANPVLASQLAPRVQALGTEQDIVQLVYEVETALAATYTSTAGTFTDATLNATMVSVAAVEARHVAVLGMILSGMAPRIVSFPSATTAAPFPAAGFQGGSGAIAAGTGV
ncbi:MAG: ferritin-like domain-containing protein, partial [Acidimicrobiales bacterium]